MTKAVIFDLDGLLINSEIISYKVYKKLLNEYDHNFSMEEYAQNFSGKTEINNVKKLINDYNLPLSIDEALNYVLKLEEELLNEGVELKNGAKELLIHLKNNKIKTAIASSSTKERALKILKELNIFDYFDEFVFANEVKNGKPNPDIFLMACDKLFEKPEDCLVLEDSEAGIQAAHSAGIEVICIPDMKMPNKTYKDMTKAVLNSLKEVIQVVRSK